VKGGRLVDGLPAETEPRDAPSSVAQRRVRGRACTGAALTPTVEVSSSNVRRARGMPMERASPRRLDLRAVAAAATVDCLEGSWWWLPTGHAREHERVRAPHTSPSVNAFSSSGILQAGAERGPISARRSLFVDPRTRGRYRRDAVENKSRTSIDGAADAPVLVGCRRQAQSALRPRDVGCAECLVLSTH